MIFDKRKSKGRSSGNRGDDTELFEVLVNEKRSGAYRKMPTERDAANHLQQPEPANPSASEETLPIITEADRTASAEPEFSGGQPSNTAPNAAKQPVQNSREDIATFEKKRPSILSIILISILAAEIVFFAVMLVKMDVLPAGLLAAVLAVVLTAAVGAVAFTWNKKRGTLFIVGLVFAVLYALVMGMGDYYLVRTWKTAQDVTTIDTTTTLVGVYVRGEDPIEDIYGTEGYLFGVLKDKDREDTNQALQMIANDLGTSISVVEYENVTDLIPALVNGTIGSAIFESYHVEMLLSMDNPEYVEMASAIRELGTYTVEKLSPNPLEDEDVGISPIQKAEEPVVTEEPKKETHAISVYLSGIDTFGTVNVQSRSDVNIIAYINTLTHQILLITTPRDFYVYTPVSGTYRDKLTHAGLWGPECSMETLEFLYDCDIDYYFRLNFSGFVNIIDALGGIEFSYMDDYPTRHLNGSEALDIARDRTWCGSDYNRGLNQTRLIRSVVDKILSTDLLYHYDDFLDAVEGNFETTIPYELLAEKVKEQLADNPSWEIITVSADGTGTSQIPYAFIYYGNSTGMYAYVCEPNEEVVQSIHDKIELICNDEIIYE